MSEYNDVVLALEMSTDTNYWAEKVHELHVELTRSLTYTARTRMKSHMADRFPLVVFSKSLEDRATWRNLIG